MRCKTATGFRRWRFGMLCSAVNPTNAAMAAAHNDKQAKELGLQSSLTSPACPRRPGRSPPPQFRGHAGQTAAVRSRGCAEVRWWGPSCCAPSRGRVAGCSLPHSLQQAPGPRCHACLHWVNQCTTQPSHLPPQCTLALSPEVLPQWPACRVVSLARMPMEGRTPRRRAALSSRSSSLQRVTSHPKL